MHRPLAAVAAASLLFTLSLLACDGETPPPRQEPRTFETPRAEANSAAEQTPWQRCARCHRRSELEGTTAEKIGQAFRNVPRMKAYARDFSDAEIAEIVSMLSPEGTASPAPAKTSPEPDAAAETSPEPEATQ